LLKINLMNKKDTLFAIILIFLISFIFWHFGKNLKRYWTSTALASVSVLTQKNEYLQGENLKVKITNKSGKTFCFSTCFPYLLEKKDKTWESHKYVECNQVNIHDSCIENEKTRAFELTLPKGISGLHRIAIPVCSDCKEGIPFKEEAKFYSNEFVIK